VLHKVGVSFECSDSSMQSSMMSFKHLRAVEQLLKLKACVIWKVWFSVII